MRHRLAVLGATGRMGARVLSLVEGDDRFEVVAALTNRDDPRFGAELRVGDRTITALDGCDGEIDVLIDFSVPVGTMSWLDRCRSAKTAMVIGPTGFSQDQLDEIAAAAKDTAILKASNFSLGVNLMTGLVADVARRLGDAYDIEIVEHHHNRKVDAPSGTAVTLTESIVEATGRDLAKDVVYGRSGETGARPARQIGVHAVRMGEIVGHHEVHFSGPGETVTIRHTAHSRDVFARGAIEAAAWVCGRPAGLYSMADLLS
jgi:4-hydroxy-tetrahydrodipicolinate reductase